MILDINEILKCDYKIFPEHRNLIEFFISSASAGRRYLLGRNEHSKILANIIEIVAFVDDFVEPETEWQNRPVITRSQIPRDGIVVNCVMSISPVTAHRRIKEIDIAGAISYSDLCNIDPVKYPYPEFVNQTRTDLQSNLRNWQELADSLSDDESRRVFKDVLQFRLTGDIRAMSAYSVRLKDQYFEVFLNLSAGEVFVDCGGFDGDTTEEFCRLCPEYKKIFLFEPVNENIKKAQNRLKGKHSIDFIENGISDKKGTLKFCISDGSACSVDGSGTCEIEVTTIDDFIKEKVSFIKMDLEGWELKALDGTKKHIRRDWPKLAIAVYHSSTDFWQIHEFIKNIRNDYHIYLRHYTEGWSETVMYFVPKQS